jgi:hypothetical protein
MGPLAAQHACIMWRLTVVRPQATVQCSPLAFALLILQCRLHVEQLQLRGDSADDYNSAIRHAIEGMPRLSSVVLQCSRWVGQLKQCASSACSNSRTH